MVASEFCNLIRQNTVFDVSALLAPRFSTTTSIESTAFEIAMMDAVQDYFDYAITLCGIPSITLEGTPADWRMIKESTRKLGEYHLEWWTNLLEPILSEFVDASEGESIELSGKIFSRLRVEAVVL